MAEWITNEEVTAAKLNDRRGFKNALRAYITGGDQKIPDDSWTRIRFNAETYDDNSEFDIAENSGTADATETLKLHDADGGFTSADVGKIVYNTTDDTYAKITAFVDSGELTIDTNIMASGEGYVIYSAQFTCKNAGRYKIYANANFNSLADQAETVVGIFKNGSVTPSSRGIIRASGADSQGVMICDELVLSVNDYIEIKAYQGSGSTKNLLDGTNETFLTIYRVA